MKKAKTTTYVIWKGDMMRDGVAVKMRAIEGVLEFLRRTGSIEYKDGAHTFLVVSKGDAGDADWLVHNCIGEGDLVGATSHRDAEERAERCLEKYDMKNGGNGRAGHSLLRFYLDKWYMTYDRWED